MPDLRLDSLSELTFGLEQVIPSLQIHPKLRAVAKVALRRSAVSGVIARELVQTDAFQRTRIVEWRHPTTRLTRLMSSRSQMAHQAAKRDCDLLRQFGKFIFIFADFVILIIFFGVQVRQHAPVQT